MLIDLLDEVGLDAMAQANFGIRSERGRFLGHPGYEAYAMLRAVNLRSGRGTFSRPPAEGTDPRVHGMAVLVDCYVRPVPSSEGGAFSEGHGGDRRAPTYGAGSAGIYKKHLK
jgi:hypothetical protein